ncbi:MAG: DUF2490 domain-containing protein [Bacteroidia bacterium]|jgi:hypothetical protein
MRFLILIAIAFCFDVGLYAQPAKQITDRQQLWYGFMTHGRISEKWSVWNDAHFVPETFFIIRSGLSYHILPEMTLTAGYAQLWLSAPATSGLPRAERRPWGQLVVNHKVSPRLFMANRVRYDGRFRQSIVDGLPADQGFDFNHRLRFLVSMRWPLKGYEIKGGTPFVNLSNEVLVNFGEQVVYNHLDQNRLWFTLGWQFGSITAQTGYMNRYVQQQQGHQFQRNHTLIMWLTWNFDFRKQADPEIFYRQP